jgi:hypothetical protein
VRHSLPLRTVLARSASFVLFASAVWSLLPLVARQLLGLGALGYGLLLGCLGAGAVAGAAALPASDGLSCAVGPGGWQRRGVAISLDLAAR